MINIINSLLNSSILSGFFNIIFSFNTFSTRVTSVLNEYAEQDTDCQRESSFDIETDGEPYKTSSWIFSSRESS